MKLWIAFFLLSLPAWCATPALVHASSMQGTGNTGSCSPSAACAVGGRLTLTSVANHSGSTTVYTGTITGGGTNGLAGNYYTVLGFTTTADNGVYLASASTTTTLTLSNANGVAETHAATAGGTLVIPYIGGAGAGTISGNMLFLGCRSDATPGTITVNDNAGNTYSAGPTTAGAHLTISTFEAFNLTAGATLIYVAPQNATSNWQCNPYEFDNIATSTATDGTITHSGTSASVTAGSFTPAVSGDLVIQFASEDGVFGADNNFTSLTTATQGTCAWKLVTADRSDVAMAQWCVQGTAAAINPTMTMGGSATFVSVAAAFKNATSGSVPGTWQLVNVLKTDTHNFAAPTSFTLQFPTQGNTLIATFDGTNAMSIAATGLTQRTLNQNNGEGVQILSHDNLTPSNSMTLAITCTSCLGAETITLYDVAGLATPTAFDVQVCNGGGTGGTANTGCNGAPANTTTITPNTITPAGTNEFCLGKMGVQGNTVGAVTSWKADSILWSPGQQGEDTPADRNNGNFHFVTSSGSATGPAISVQYPGSGNWAGWAYAAACFKAPAVGASMVQRRR